MTRALGHSPQHALAGGRYAPLYLSERCSAARTATDHGGDSVRLTGPGVWQGRKVAGVAGVSPERSLLEEVPVIRSNADLAGELRRILRAAEAREGRTIGRAGLAKRIGVSQSSLYAYLKGTTLIPVDALSALLRQLDADRQLALRLCRARDSLTEPVVPPQPVLPLDLPSFVARTELLTKLDRLRGQGRRASTVPITVISGAGGIGKTTLAVRWAHQRLSRFPDGCLYLDLRGFHPDSPLDPGEALAALLRRLGVPGTGVPLGLEERRERYLQILSGKRMLILLDNAFSAEQVRPLLPPGTSGCFVLVTSRDRLSGLVVGSGAHPVPLRALSDGDAGALLAARLGDARIAAEPEAVAKIVAACAGLPLALSAVAGRAQSNPGITLEALAAELGDAQTRSGVLDEGDALTGVGTVLSWSLAALTSEQARVFALLGIAPDSEIGLPTVASLIGLPLTEAKAVLHELERVSLVYQESSGRYRMHDVVRHYAAETAQKDLEPDAREAAVRRVVDFYIHTAYAADRFLDPHRPRIEPAPPVAGVQVQPVGDREAAMEWFDAEHENLVSVQRAAVVRQWHLAVWHLVRSLSIFQIYTGRRHNNLVMWQAASDAAAHLPDPVFSIQTDRALGHALTGLGQYEEAIGHLDRALALSERHNDPLQQAITHTNLMWVWSSAGDFERSLSYAVRCRDLFQKLGNSVGEAHALSCASWALANLGDYNAGRGYCEAALGLFRRYCSPRAEATALDTLGHIDYHTGKYARAIDNHEQAVCLLRSVGDTSGVLADALDRLGRSHVALDHREQARVAWQAALDTYRLRGLDEGAARVQRKLDDLARRAT
jgi:tetratricopeptide (TPR) repeat protein